MGKVRERQAVMKRKLVGCPWLGEVKLNWTLRMGAYS